MLFKIYKYHTLQVTLLVKLLVSLFLPAWQKN